MAEEHIEEELAIIEERSRSGSGLSAASFEQPISGLCQRPCPTLPLAASVGDAIAVLQSEKVGALAVVDAEGHLAGIVSERDLLRKILGRISDYGGMPVTEIMTPNPESLRREDSIVYVMNKMQVGGFRHVPIVDEHGRPEHMISIRDVLAFVLGYFSADILNIPSEPFRGKPERYGG